MRNWIKCKDLEDRIIRDRQRLHQIPETKFYLPKTKKYVLDRLSEMGISDITFNEADDGFIAVIHGKKSDKKIALRTDMDALPIEEENDVPYKSQHKGKMHACGHDAHMAMLLGAAKIINDNRDKLNGDVVLIFQTAEEITRGAMIMCDEDRLKDVTAVFGCHIGSIISKEIPSGTVIAVPGPVMASVDKFVIKITGKGCHGSTPEKGVDTINIASHISINLQEIIAREISATHSAVLTIGHMEMGKSYNAIPTEGLIEGTVRALNEADRRFVMKRIKEISEKTAETFRGKAEVEVFWGAPPVINNEEMAVLAGNAAREVVGDKKLITKLDAPNMGGEDFAYYLEKVPGAFIFLSSADKDKKTDVPHHNSKFNVDEDVLWIGSAVFVNIVENYLE